MTQRDFDENIEEEPVYDEKFYESILEQLPKSSFTNLNDFSQYSRPSLAPHLLTETNDFTFMQIDCDYYVGHKQAYEEECGIIRIYGVTKEGNSVLAHIHDFIAYFYIEKPLELDDDANTLNQLRMELMVKTVKIFF